MRDRECAKETEIMKKKATIRNKLYKLCYGENSGDCNESLLSSLFFFLAFCFTIY